MNPNNLFVTSIFIAIATIFSIGFGWLVQQERLPLRKMMDFSDYAPRSLRIASGSLSKLGQKLLCCWELLFLWSYY